MHATLPPLLARSRVRPDHAPESAAVLVWQQVAARFPDASASVAALSPLDRVVLVLVDAAGMGHVEVGQALNLTVEAVDAVHRTARGRAGLPPVGDGCERWEPIRASHRPGDPIIVERLRGHSTMCPVCSAHLTNARPAAARERQRQPGDGVRPAATTAIALALSLVVGIGVARAAPTTGHGSPDVTLLSEPADADTADAIAVAAPRAEEDGSDELFEILDDLRSVSRRVRVPMATLTVRMR